MLTISFTITILLMILLPIGTAALIRRRFQVPWLLFGIGTLTFIASQVVHFPLNDLLMKLGILSRSGTTDPNIPLIQTSIVLGLTAGLCEETARWAGYRLLKRFRRLEDGLMLGLGHGGFESMVFGGVLTAATISTLLPLVGTDLAKLNLPADQLDVLTVQLNMLTDQPILGALSPLIERILAMLIHITLSVMVLQAFRRSNLLYYAAAVLYHTLFDAVLVYVSTIITNHYVVLLIIIALLLPGLVWMAWLLRREMHPRPVFASARKTELRIFFTAVRKELLQQWRTRRVLVVMAVFILFGLTSPMAAKFMPEIIKSMPGAEQFAGLIPVPTTADAMAQYVKNISQFGFMLAVLLGMNAVAGEKETGTGAMILSKPMPRWAFVLSKFTAQAVVYIAAFLVAGIGAYYYTVILFGGFNIAVFSAINGLLLAWLLVFVGAAMLGSVIGSSVASAAGVGLGLSIMLLLAGSIPQYGMLMPNGLITWASMLGAGQVDPVPSNTGALAACFVLIVLCLLWSVALFERQEI